MSILIEQVDEILAYEKDPAPDLQDLFQYLHGVDFQDAAAADMEDARAEMQAVFDQMGLDVDLSGFDPGMSEEEMAAQAAGLADQMRQQAGRAQGAKPPRKISKREAQAAERQRRIDDARKTGLTTIYRRLAKALHPDLEPDPHARERKSALMQELTAAHKRQDLHTLLRLEMTWIHGEGQDASRLADDTLAIYTEALKQQAEQLDLELALLHGHPKYIDVVEDVGFGVTIIADGAAQASSLDHMIAILSDGVRRLRSAHALEEIRQTIQLRRGARKLRKR